MSMLTIFNSASTTLATDQLVYTADEMNSLHSLLQKIELLDKKLAEAENSIKQAKAEARDIGERAGFEKGRAIARRKISAALIAAQREVSSQRKKMHETSVGLALEIVRRIGLEVSTPEALVSFARASACELDTNELANLCVHPDAVEEVTQRLSMLPENEVEWLLEVIGDETLAPGDCFLKTNQGSLFIGLETQLRVIERSLNEHVD